MSYTYNELSCNCQHFTKKLLETLDISPAFSPHVTHYLDNLRSSGYYNRTFWWNNYFGKHFELKETSHTFQSHRELDIFVQRLFAKCPSFLITFPSEYQILKAFDDAFWINWSQSEDSEQYKPDRDSTGNVTCPFNKLRMHSPERLSMRVHEKLMLGNEDFELMSK